MTVDFGGPYDCILLPNILHHFNSANCVQLMRKVYDSLDPDGIVLTLEFIPNEDRVSPPTPATFALTMLATTDAGDAYTFAEYERMFEEVGLVSNELMDVPYSPFRLVVSQAVRK